MNTLFGFGGFKIQCGSHTASFPDNTGLVGFKVIKQEWQTRDFADRQKIRGWQAQITVTLHNLTTLMAIQLSYLVNVLNEHAVSGTALTITPRYNATNDTGLVFYCDLTSDFNPQDIANCEAGQSIDLVFRERGTRASMPNVLSNVTIYDVIDHDGDNLVDYAGNTVQASF